MHDIFHHAISQQSARRECQQSPLLQGVPHLVYVEGASPWKNGATGEAGWPAVSAAVGNAALVVVEMMPTPPYCDWLKVRCLSLPQKKR